MYFAIYEKVYLMLSSENNHLNEPQPKTLLMTTISGGVAGSLSWFMAYPLDTFKTVLFAQDYKDRKFRGIIDAAIQTTKTKGIKGVYSGVVITSIRGFPVSGGIFTAYEMTKNSLVELAQGSSINRF